MIDRLKSYPEYRDSGNQVLGRVPAHWNAARLGTMGQFLKGSGGSKDDDVPEGIPCVRYGDLYAQYHGFIRQTRSCVTPERAAEYTSIKRGDVLFAASGETIEEIGTSAVVLMDEPAVAGGDVIILRPTVSVLPEYLGYAASSPMAVDQKARMGRGVTVMHVYPNALKHLWLPVPPLQEQHAIVRFLDHADRLIRLYIAAKQKLIELLEEERYAIIRRTVTRGLDSGVALKPSGLNGLEQVPQHWDVLPLKRILRALIDCEHKTAPSVADSPYHVVRTTGVRRGRLRIEGTYCTTADAYAEWTRRGVPQPGDVIFTREAPAGEACLVPRGLSVCLGQRTVLMQVRQDNYDSGFLVHMIYGGPPAERIKLASRGSTVGHFNMDDIASMTILMPPVEEQRALVHYIESETSAIETAARRTEEEIGLVRAYRTRLVADVVTGKLDVRGPAASLPEAGEDVDLLSDDLMGSGEGHDAPNDPMDETVE